MRLPTAKDQLTFLSKVERIFNEGGFTATYKCALMIVLSELAVENGYDDGEALLLKDSDVADRFIELYWQQAAPYREAQGQPVVLSQNLGAQAAVVTALIDFRSRTRAATPQQALGSPGYPRLRRRVRDVVRAQPVQYLQNFGGRTDMFLFTPVSGGLMLLPGVAFHFRRFQRLIQQLARSKWVEHLGANTRNVAALGDAAGLESFLFEASRQSLAGAAKRLRKLTGNTCFYCGRRAERVDVDHFVPFSLYPRDLAANFVLSHRECNVSKSDTLAAKAHLGRWLERVHSHADDFAEIGQAAGFPISADTSVAVARWAYESGAAAGARAWRRRSAYETIDRSYLSLF